MNGIILMVESLEKAYLIMKIKYIDKKFKTAATQYRVDVKKGIYFTFYNIPVYFMYYKIRTEMYKEHDICVCTRANNLMCA